jgi:hypothetical protein
MFVYVCMVWFYARRKAKKKRGNLQTNAADVHDVYVCICVRIYVLYR